MTEPVEIEPGLSGEVDSRPQVALPSAGVPTWAMALAAVAIGSAVMLGLNGSRNPQASAVTRNSYGGQAATDLPPSLQGGLGALDPTFDQGALRSRSEVFAVRTMPAPSSGFDRPARPLTMRQGPDAGAAFAYGPGYKSSESAIANGGFATQPMPGGLGSPGAGQMRNAGPPGSSLVFDSGATGQGAAGDEKLPGEAAPARASLIRNRPALVAQGEIIAATLETPINSDRPGLIRAIVSREVRSFDGSRILIPRGSRLIGEFRADQQVGRRRILATWNRLIRPDGVAIRLDSPSSDSVGGTGIPGKVDTHFFERFANAALQTAFQVGVNLANRQGNNVIIGSTQQMPGMIGQAIIPGADAQPTVTTKAGAVVSVFVARDLDFTGVPLVK